jgi:3(or 17)beta-hydroxysteroid dehydrogenase
MGAATARLLAREDAKVVIADMLEHDGRHVAESIGDTAHFERLDVTDEANWEAVVDATVARFGMLNVPMNNAGISGSAKQDFYGTDASHRIMAVNAAGTSSEPSTPCRR